MQKRIIEPSPELQEELRHELTDLEARLAEAEGGRERSRLEREIRRIRRELSILGPPYVLWGREPDAELGLPADSRAKTRGAQSGDRAGDRDRLIRSGTAQCVIRT